MSADEFLPDNTPRGLPGPLPPGERILWQGAPSAGGIAQRAFHARLVAGWFLGAAVLFGTVAAVDDSAGRAIAIVGPTLAVGFAALLLIAGFGWLVRRTTTYTLTDRRVVMQVGIALPVTLNLPFARIEGAGLKPFADGTGDIPLQLRKGERVAYLHLWPHARPWRVTQPEPMLRSVPDAEWVAAMLARAFAAHAGPERVVREEDAGVPVIVGRPRAVAAPGRLAAAG